MPAQQVLRIFLLLSGKTNNVVINGLRSALPLARARKPNNHIAQGSALGKHYTPHLHSPCFTLIEQVFFEISYFNLC